MKVDMYMRSAATRALAHIYANMDTWTQGKLKALNTSALIILNY